jgi:hypothetical protein
LQKANCQFYYSDIIATKLANKTYSNLKNNHIKKITSSNGTKNSAGEENVSIMQNFSANWETIRTKTTLATGIKSSSTTYYQNNKILKKEDEGKNVNSLLRYNYDATEKLISLVASSIDTTVFDGFFEKHFFTYDEKGLPTKMLKIKNEEDSTFVNFIKDEQGNIAEERWMHHNELVETYYYYYNEKNWLTDIVKFNMKAGKMLPEFLFEYDTNGNISQMTQIPFGSSNYFVWHYVYNEQNLKLAEFCYNKKNELIGKMEYRYE